MRSASPSRPSCSGPRARSWRYRIALTIQALFFGDGGITTLGANCFNMAIVGSLVAYALIGCWQAGSCFTSRRRVVAAAIAGYVAINASALLAAIEFGIQPCSVPRRRWNAALRAVSAEHRHSGDDDRPLDLRRTGRGGDLRGLVAYLQVADPALLRGTAGMAVDSQIAAAACVPVRCSRLWIAVAALMLI